MLIDERRHDKRTIQFYIVNGVTRGLSNHRGIGIVRTLVNRRGIIVVLGVLKIPIQIHTSIRIDTTR